MMNPQPGDTIWVRAFKADGTCYRWWQAVIEEFTPDTLVTKSAIGNPVFQADREWKQTISIRSIYWFDRPYNLLEVYDAEDQLVQLYANIANLPQLVDGQLHFTDHELDVYCMAGETPQLIDQDEFEEAAVKFGYSPEFQHQCYQIAAEVLELVSTWQVKSKYIQRLEIRD